MARFRVSLERLARLFRRERSLGDLQRNAGDNLKLRPAANQEIRALRSTHASQCRALGCAYAFPDLAGDPSYRVIMLSQPGEPASALVVKRTHEAFVIAASPEPFRGLARDKEAVAANLRAAGVDELHAWTPPSARVDRMAPVMRALGFRPCSPGWRVWYREV